ncbi:hypothetical protein [Catenulispora subtropica]|uniref:Histidine kinase n=1 Tax=Catenulispora subtropica TaxID=450798 RepID=A0ABN2TEB5_9ACTN
MDQDLSRLIRITLDDPVEALRIREAARRLVRSRGLETAVSLILEETMALTGADAGYLQVAEPASAALRIVAYAGSDAELLDRHAVDCDVDPALSLTDADGNLVGRVSIQFPHYGAMPEQAATLSRIYLRFAGEVLARSLWRPSATSPGEQRRGEPVRTAPSVSPLRAELVELSDMIVRSLFSVGLSLASARELIGDGAAREHVTAAVAELDHILDTLRATAAGLGDRLLSTSDQAPL